MESTVVLLHEAHIVKELSMIYAIVPFQRNEEEKLRQRIEALRGSGRHVYTDYAPIAYFVSYKGTTRELAEDIGFGGGESGTGIVIPISNYYGYAAKDLWEWMRIYEYDT